MKKFDVNYGICELCLTYACNVRCANCSNLCTQAPAARHMTVEHVENFIADSVHNNHSWGMITLHGGEPVLNPHVYGIVEKLMEYRRDHNPGVKFWLLTNNSAPGVRRIAVDISIKYGIPLGISTKRKDNSDGNGNPMEYVPINSSPIDKGIAHDFNCFQPQNCGVCYNIKGYYPCSPMAAAARVFDYIESVKSIADLTAEHCDGEFKKHCGHCGFSAPDRPRVYAQETSQTWETALKKYIDERIGS